MSTFIKMDQFIRKKFNTISIYILNLIHPVRIFNQNLIFTSKKLSHMMPNKWMSITVKITKRPNSKITFKTMKQAFDLRISGVFGRYYAASKFLMFFGVLSSLRCRVV